MEETYIVKRGISDNAKRKLVINPNSISFENKDIIGQTFTTFNSEDITELRFGIKWYVFEVTFGREYQIFVRNRKGEILKINFKSYFGYNKKAYTKLYNQIINSIWKNQFVRIADDFIDEFENGETFKIGEVMISPDGLLLKKQDENLISWSDVQTQDYVTYFSIYSKKDPATINKGFSYHLDWNTEVLKRVVKYIIKKKASANSG